MYTTSSNPALSTPLGIRAEYLSRPPHHCDLCDNSHAVRNILGQQQKKSEQLDLPCAAPTQLELSYLAIICMLLVIL
ncbi:hypothetical protein E2C01_018150 [Portunus trituberculatus]|uniref:Uncharacterized protein n=1 Tax=Portunus trituberculatus TaxID=210409 RepID=A0A5B7DTS0_PORTR|nr:hypothetical protein [Portunus trituberculatus]